ncbi:MAG TPA: A/G-specific adenine glycosylase [Bacteroidota bacterium]
MKKSGMTATTNRQTSLIVSRIFRWYSRSARDLPWRNEHDPYRILVSEVMLQQTQVSRVVEKYPGFIAQFPGIGRLARARISTVIRAWKGMGYNSRAVRLHQLAWNVLRNHGGRIPTDIEALRSLPGIGKYTAHAVSCFAFGQRVPVVDTNVERVLGRLFPSQARRLDIWDLASRVLPSRNASRWNQALMDLGSTICTARNPKCGACPVAGLCPSSFKANRPPNVHLKAEPSRNGLPNRIYRGRIVELMRNLPPRKFMAVSQIGPRIKPAYSDRDERWLAELLGRLEQDGLLTLGRSNSGLTASLRR